LYLFRFVFSKDTRIFFNNCWNCCFVWSFSIFLEFSKDFGYFYFFFKFLFLWNVWNLKKKSSFIEFCELFCPITYVSSNSPYNFWRHSPTVTHLKQGLAFKMSELIFKMYSYRRVDKIQFMDFGFTDGRHNDFRRAQFLKYQHYSWPIHKSVIVFFNTQTRCSRENFQLKDICSSTIEFSELIISHHEHFNFNSLVILYIVYTLCSKRKTFI
jgi:hypothetical protein